MNALATRSIALGIALMLAVSPALAQDAPDSSKDQYQGQPAGQGQYQDASPDNTSSVDSSSAPVAADPAAVIAQWGPAPNIGPEADKAVAQRWFRDQNTIRARWSVPTATRDPYLDWMAENLLRNRLGQDSLPQPLGLSKPGAATCNAQCDQAVLTVTEFWTVSDDLWQASLDGIEDHPSQFWQDAHPGEQWFTRDRYLRLDFWRDVKFDRYRLMGVAGRVDTSNSPPAGLLIGNKEELEQIAPGSVDAYQPMTYPDNMVAIVAYDPWINPDGVLRP